MKAAFYWRYSTDIIQSELIIIYDFLSSATGLFCSHSARLITLNPGDNLLRDMSL